MAFVIKPSFFAKGMAKLWKCGPSSKFLSFLLSFFQSSSAFKPSLARIQLIKVKALFAFLR